MSGETARIADERSGLRGSSRARGWRRLARVVGWLALGLFVVVAALFAWLATHEGKRVSDHPYFAAERPGTQVIAHRGGAGLRPENTLEAFRHALDIGVDILEMDVRATADGELVVIHDADVRRTTDGAGAVSSLTLEEVKRLDAGYRWTADGGSTFPFRGRGLSVPTLGEVLESFSGTRLVVEPKAEGLAEALCRAVREHAAAGRVLVASFRDSTMEEFRRACPEVGTSASSDEAFRFLAMQRTGVAAAFSPSMQALQIPERFGGLSVPTRDFVAAAHERNLKVHVWTINDAETMRRLVEAGVDGIMTDYPDRLLALLGR